jgi:hypothetical protein
MTVKEIKLTGVGTKALGEYLLELYPEPILKEFFYSYCWNDEGLKASLARREGLVEKGRHIGNTTSEVTSFFNDIHEWGFNQKIHETVAETSIFKDKSVALFKAWKNGSKDEKIKSVGDLMECKGIGIAKTSKFAAMLDPDFGAIYDSRVSIALRPLLHKNKMFFPTVGRRQSKSRQHFGASAMTTQKGRRFELAEKYFLYLEMLSEVRAQTDFKTNTEIEMGLFMIGKDWPISSLYKD